MEECWPGRPPRDSAREEERRRLLPAGHTRNWMLWVDGRSSRVAKDGGGSHRFRRKVRSSVPVPTPKSPRHQPKRLHNLMWALSGPRHGALRWEEKLIGIHRIQEWRHGRLFPHDKWHSEARLQNLRRTKGSGKARNGRLLGRRGGVSAVSVPTADHVVNKLFGNPQEPHQSLISGDRQTTTRFTAYLWSFL